MYEIEPDVFTVPAVMHSTRSTGSVDLQDQVDANGQGCEVPSKDPMSNVGTRMSADARCRWSETDTQARRGGPGREAEGPTFLSEVIIDGQNLSNNLFNNLLADSYFLPD